MADAPLMARCTLLLLLLCFGCSASLVLAQNDVAADSNAKNASDIVTTKDVDPTDDGQTTVKTLIDVEKEADVLIRANSDTIPEDGLARTPLQLAIFLLEALRKDDYERASSYLDMRYLPDEIAQYPAQRLLPGLAIVWEQQNIIDLATLSDDPEGNLNDGLPSYRDRLGSIIKTNGDEVPVFLQRIPHGDNEYLWKISNATVARIPELWTDLGYGPIAVWLERHLPSYRVAGLRSWQILAAVLLLGICWYASLGMAWLVMRVAHSAVVHFPQGIERFCRGPLRLFLFLVFFRQSMDELALSMTARIYLNSAGVDYLAFSILLVGAIDLVRDIYARRMERANNRQGLALLRPASTILKWLAVLIVAVVWAEQAGYNMSTLLAGLGVGSLAIALAAQKTLENVIGAFTLYAARPVRPGDLCRFGETVGVVEEIGLRSTLIRTLDRTLKAVPNSVFSSTEVENISLRDRIRFYRHIEVVIDTSQQLETLLGNLRTLFQHREELLEDTISIRLETIEFADARIRIDAAVATTDYQQYLKVAEQLNLGIIREVEGAGAAFSHRPTAVEC